ncbi:GNAT family N-acetyltransferase [Paenibacillus sp. SYP-B3998]|uniref:GNAT family N-acetyltransferase n=1 Tax=Paenibacillus sp. SYP-B3998 TaxID=2678564 RepID=A0A6G4A692_9BACL|nr:GNAT family N-acetyltransferase [Paenibacillus sp. SYP-B3998]NEW09840.1 GNAT family N-acetyltransferase [Paenibacillus sp. SYP-B3998]
MNGIRTLKQEELLESFSLAEFAFQFELTSGERAERVEKTDPNQISGYFVDGTLAAQLTILNCYTWLNGQCFAMGGIAGVATWPEYRRNGMVGQLLVQALKTMKEQGQTVSFLSPFKFEFYRKYGWETYIDFLKYEIPADKLPKFQITEGGKIVRVSKDWELLNPIYEEHAVRYNGMLKRDEQWWNQRYFKFKKGTAALYCNSQGEHRGYVFYQVKDKVATIHEMVFLDEEARRGLWKFIADHDSMIDKVELNAPVDDALPFLTHDPKFKQEKIAYFSARIVDVQTFLTQYSFAAREQATSLYLHISDSHAEWNNGIYVLEIAAKGKEAVVTKLSEGESLSGYDILSCTIQTLSALLIGYQKAGFLSKIGRLQGTPELVSKFEAAIPVRTTYLSDFF